MKKFILGPVLAAASLVIFLIMAEYSLSWTAVIPPFPKYLTRPARWKWPALNSMGFLDKERPFENFGHSIRVLFIGDSFLEINGSSIVPLCEQAVESEISRNIEFINLGESDTDPVDYYWRLKTVGMHFNPEAVCIFIFEGNDFISKARFVRGMRPDNFIAVYPQQSVLSRFFPKTAALFGAFYYYCRSFKDMPWAPRGANWADLSQAKKEEKLIELISEKAKVSLAKAGGYVKGLSAGTRRFVFDSGYLPGYYLDQMVNLRFHGVKLENRHKAEYTARCIIEIKNLFLKNNHSAGIMVFFIPAAEKADPEFLSAFQDLFKTEGLPFGALLEDKEFIVFSGMLRDEGIEAYNMADAFAPARGTYALDGHWNKKGIESAVKYISSKINENLSL